MQRVRRRRPGLGMAHGREGEGLAGRGGEGRAGSRGARGPVMLPAWRMDGAEGQVTTGGWLILFMGSSDGRLVAVACAEAGDCRPTDRSLFFLSFYHPAPTMPLSEARYLAALPAQSKDAAPDSLYQVRPRPAAQLTAAETRNRWKGCVWRRLQGKTRCYRPYRCTQNHKPRH